VLAGLLVPPTLLELSLLALLRGGGRIRAAATVELIQGIVAAVLTIVSLIWLGTGVAGVLVAQIVGVVVALTLLSILLHPAGLSVAPVASRRLLARMLGFGLRADIGNAMHVTGFRLDIVFMNIYATTAAVGIYAVATRVAELLFVLPYAVSIVMMPRTTRSTDAQRARETPRAFSATLALSAASALVLLVIGAPLIRFVYSDEYASAYAPLAILLGGVVAFGVANVLMNDVVGRGHPGLISVNAAIGLALTAGLDLWLIPSHGMNGAALASTIVYLVNAMLAVVFYFRVSRVRPADFIRSCVWRT
jgi:O-antigen/teichoic acid export membrane protein